MKKVILISVVIVILIVIGGCFYFFLGESEEDLRKNIENEYYENQFLECKLNDHGGFDSRQNCEGAVRCISVEMSELVRKEDLKDMSNKMKWSDDDEHTMVVYFTEELDISHEKLDLIMKYCAEQYGYNSSATQ